MARKPYSIDDLIRLLGDQMDAARSWGEEEAELPLRDRLRVLDMIGRTCSRLAALIAQQEKTAGNGTDRLNQVLQQVLDELRSGNRAAERDT